METLTIDGHTVYIDSEDAALISGFKWILRPTTGNLYAVANRRKSAYLMHRLIAGPDIYETVYHINTNGLDNRKNNMLIDKSKSKGQTGSSRFRGVSWSPDKHGWKAVVWDARTKHLTYCGVHSTEEEAAEAYDRGATAIFGKYARLNFEGSDSRKAAA